LRNLNHHGKKQKIKKKTREIIVGQMAITTTEKFKAERGGRAGEAPRFKQVCSRNSSEGRMAGAE